MFTNREMEVDAVMQELDREAQLVMLRSEARRAPSIERRPRGLRFPMPEWVKRPPFALRPTHR